MDSTTAELLRSLASKLGTTTEYLWQVSVHGTKVEGAVMLVFAVLAGIIVSFTAKGLHMTEEEVITKGIKDPIGFTMFCTFSLSISFIAFVAFLYSGLNSVLAPEAWALKSLLNQLK